MTEFEDQLKKAIERGHRMHEARQAEKRADRMTADQLKIRHNEFRLPLSDRIEKALRSMAHQLPGFEYENIYGDRGWGGAVSRDETVIQGGQRRSVYSRLELAVKPLSDLKLVDITGKGTVRNREIFTRQHHRPIDEADLDEFTEAIDRWVLEFAQLYAASEHS
jgi:hypothetical protein